MSRPKHRKSVRRSAPARSRPRVRRSRGKGTENLDQRVRRIVREVVREELEPLEDRLDYLASEASLADGDPIPAEEVWKRLGE